MRAATGGMELWAVHEAKPHRPWIGARVRLTWTSHTLNGMDDLAHRAAACGWMQSPSHHSLSHESK